MPRHRVLGRHGVNTSGWHEDVSEKDVVFPFGNVQYKQETYKAPDGTVFHTTPITDLGIKQGYSSFGSWDKETVGRGIRWSSLTDEQKKAFMSDPWNNIYVDGDKVIQVRYRVRVVKDYKPGWGGFIPTTGAVDNVLGYTTEIYDNTYKYITPQGKLDFIPKYGQKVDGQQIGAIITAYRSAITNHSKLPYDPGLFTHDWRNTPSVISYKGYWYRAIPIALVARRNTGTFHPVYNPNGSALFAGGKRFWEVTPTAPSFNIVGVDKDNKQFKVAGDKTNEIKPNYFIEVTGSSGNDGRYWVTKVEYSESEDKTIITVANSIPDTTADGKLTSDFGYVKYCFDNRDTNSGLIETGKSGRPDGKYADEINEGDVKDLRNYALRVTDYQRLLEKEFNKLLLGEMRGWEVLPINRVYKGEIYFTGATADKNKYLKNHREAYVIYVHKGDPNGDYAICTNIEGDDIEYTPEYHNGVVYNLDEDKTQAVLSLGTPYSRHHYKSYPRINEGGSYGFGLSSSTAFNGILMFCLEKNMHYKSYIMCDIAGKRPGVEKFQKLGYWRVAGDYGESFIPTDDFTATVDSSDTSVIKISGDKRYAIKKNCRLFVRNTSNVSIGVFRVKSVSFDGTNTVVKLTGSAGSGGATVKVSTCIASGRNGKTSAGKEVYVFKLSRRPLNLNNIRVLIRKKDGSWYAYNNFEPVSVYNSSTSIQDFIDDVGGLNKEVKFNEKLNWIGINISDIYSSLGYSNEDDFKQNAVIEVYYESKANPLKLFSTNNVTTLSKSNYGYFVGLGAHRYIIEYTIGKIAENMMNAKTASGYGYPYLYKTNIEGDVGRDLLFNNLPTREPRFDFPDIVSGTGFGIAAFPVLVPRSGKVRLVINYNEVIHDYNTGTKGWEGGILIRPNETTTTDANGNRIIVGQKEAELPYFVWNEDEE